jgi:hypothetical protein
MITAFPATETSGPHMTQRKAEETHPAVKRRGADPQVPVKPNDALAADTKERKLEQGLEESMAGSDPVSITQPVTLSSPRSNKEEQGAGLG